MQYYYKAFEDLVKNHSVDYLMSDILRASPINETGSLMAVLVGSPLAPLNWGQEFMSELSKSATGMCIHFAIYNS